MSALGKNVAAYGWTKRGVGEGVAVYGWDTGIPLTPEQFERIINDGFVTQRLLFSALVGERFQDAGTTVTIHLGESQVEQKTAEPIEGDGPVAQRVAGDGLVATIAQGSGEAAKLVEGDGETVHRFEDLSLVDQRTLGASETRGRVSGLGETVQRVEGSDGV